MIKVLIGAFAGVAAVLLVVTGFALQGLEAKVYLVPLEARPELLQSLRVYYQEELALEVEILPSIQLTSETWNRQRRQVSAERIIDLIYGKYRALGSRRRVVVIGVTSRDLYIEMRPWVYAFSYRDSASLAIVSYARMDPRAYGGAADNAVIETRVRKIVTRNLGVMRFGIPMTASRHNLMYQDILGLDDLDALVEDLYGAGFPGARPLRQPQPEGTEVL